MLRFRFAGVALAATLMLAGCQTTADTPSGSPEVTLAGVRADQVRPALVNITLNRRWRIKSDSPYSLVVERPTENVGAAILLGTGMGSPMERMSFAIAEVPGATRVVADMAFVGNAGTGFERPTRIAVSADAQAILAELQQMFSRPGVASR